MRRQDPQGIAEQLKAERAAEGVPEHPDNVEYDATRARFAAERKQRQARDAQRKKREAELKRRGIDPARHLSPELLALDEAASHALGVRSMREELAQDATQAASAAHKRAKS